MNGALRVRLTGRAMRFLWLLQDFGHLDEDRLNEIFIGLADIAGNTKEQPVDLPLVRRVAAAVLFGQGENLRDIESGVLAEDWPLLFS